jgi:hypothetical protein
MVSMVSQIDLDDESGAKLSNVYVVRLRLFDRVGSRRPLHASATTGSLQWRPSSKRQSISVLSRCELSQLTNKY